MSNRFLFSSGKIKKTTNDIVVLLDYFYFIDITFPIWAG